MKHSHRSAIALITSGLLAGGALGAAALARQHSGGDSAAQVASVGKGTTGDSDMSGAIQDVLSRSAALHNRMLTARADLADLNRQLRQQRAAAEAAAYATSVVAQATLSPEDTSGSTSSGTDSSGTDTSEGDDTTPSTGSTPGDDDSTQGTSENSPSGGGPTGSEPTGTEPTDDDPQDNGGSGQLDD